MFASLKNKIREEIGSDVSTVVRNAGSVRGINSKHLSQVILMYVFLVRVIEIVKIVLTLVKWISDKC